MKAEPISLEEQKKLRRRTQIASSVQRHREKKKVRAFFYIKVGLCVGVGVV
jgi:hypothetical protein